MSRQVPFRVDANAPIRVVGVLPDGREIEMTLKIGIVAFTDRETLDANGAPVVNVEVVTAYSARFINGAAAVPPTTMFGAGTLN